MCPSNMHEWCEPARSIFVWMLTLSMNHSTVHDAGHDTVVEVVHLQSNALEETHTGSEGKLITHNKHNDT